MKTLALIGTSGFVGTRLINRLKDKYSVVNFDKQQNNKAHSTGFIPPYTLSQGLDRTIKFEFVHEKRRRYSFVVMKYSQSPNHSRQKYYLTPKGTDLKTQLLKVISN